MSARALRSIAALVLAPWLAMPSAMAKEHLHEADDHHESVVHRHVQLHHADAADHDHARLAVDDEHVVWLDAATLHQSTYRLAASTSLAATPVQLAPPPSRWIAKDEYSAPPVHGPPRASVSLRGPPPPFLPDVI